LLNGRGKRPPPPSGTSAAGGGLAPPDPVWRSRAPSRSGMVSRPVVVQVYKPRVRRWTSSLLLHPDFSPSHPRRIPIGGLARTCVAHATSWKIQSRVSPLHVPALHSRCLPRSLSSSANWAAILMLWLSKPLPHGRTGKAGVDRDRLHILRLSYFQAAIWAFSTYPRFPSTIPPLDDPACSCWTNNDLRGVISGFSHGLLMRTGTLSGVWPSLAISIREWRIPVPTILVNGHLRWPMTGIQPCWLALPFHSCMHGLLAAPRPEIEMEDSSQDHQSETLPWPIAKMLHYQACHSSDLLCLGGHAYCPEECLCGNDLWGGRVEMGCLFLLSIDDWRTRLVSRHGQMPESITVQASQRLPKVASYPECVGHSMQSILIGKVAELMPIVLFGNLCRGRLKLVWM
jgi:hypothetical protein